MFSKRRSKTSEPTTLRGTYLRKMSPAEMQRLKEEIINLLDELETRADVEPEGRPPFFMTNWWRDAAA